MSRLDSQIEAILFAAREPMSTAEIHRLLSDASVADIEAAVARVQNRCVGPDRGIEIVAVADGYQFRTKSEHAELIQALFKDPPLRLTKASLEVLAVIAYRQPITRAELEKIRGVDCGGVMKSLLDRDIIRTLGRSDAVGKPLLYGTSEAFLKIFGLKSILELPSLEEFESLGRAEMVQEGGPSADLKFESYHAEAANLDEEEKSAIDELLDGVQVDLKTIQTRIRETIEPVEAETQDPQ